MTALLTAASVLKGKQADSNPADQYVLEQYGAVLADGDAVRDGKIVTASFDGHLEFGWRVAEAPAGLGEAYKFHNQIGIVEKQRSGRLPAL